MSEHEDLHLPLSEEVDQLTPAEVVRRMETLPHPGDFTKSESELLLNPDTDVIKYIDGRGLRLTAFLKAFNEAGHVLVAVHENHKPHEVCPTCSNKIEYGGIKLLKVDKPCVIQMGIDYKGDPAIRVNAQEMDEGQLQVITVSRMNLHNMKEHNSNDGQVDMEMLIDFISPQRPIDTSHV
ncbi:MAG TPA: hypothetical protein VMR41_06155 [Patescibacteria group bacterium]|nr:hypothetical protein [Patescibacteria group bacterium]